MQKKICLNYELVYNKFSTYPNSFDFRGFIQGYRVNTLYTEQK